MKPEWNALNQKSCEKILSLLKKKRKRKEKGIDTFLVQKIKEYSVFITNIYLLEKMLVLPCIWECIQKDMNIISNVWKVLWFTFFNIYLPHKKSKQVFVVFPCAAVFKKLKVGDYNGQFVVEIIFYSLARRTECLSCFLQPQVIQTPIQFLSLFKCCSQLKDTTRNKFWDKIWINCDLVTIFLLLLSVFLCFRLLIHLLRFGKWIQHLLPDMKVLTGLKWPALGRSIQILKQGLVHRGSCQH